MNILRNRWSVATVGVLSSTLAVAACSSSAEDNPQPVPSVMQLNPQPTPVIETVCKADRPEKWGSIPEYLNIERLAGRLAVPFDNIVQNGKFGPAICEIPLSTDRISSIEAPIVEVSNMGSPCVVMGTQERPVPGTVTQRILAACADIRRI